MVVQEQTVRIAFGPETGGVGEAREASPDIVVSSLAQFPALLEEDLTGGWAP